MKGSALSRWSQNPRRYARTLPLAAALVGLVAMLPSCAGKAKEQSAPQPKEVAAKPEASAKPQASAEAPKSKATTTPTPAPTPAQPVAAEPPKPEVIDSAAIAAEFCKKIATGVKAAIKADSAPSNPNAVVRKIVPTVPENTANVALAKDTNCR